MAQLNCGNFLFSGGFGGKQEPILAGMRGDNQFNRAPGGQAFPQSRDPSDTESVASGEAWFPIGRSAKKQRLNDEARGRNFGGGSGNQGGFQGNNQRQQPRNPWQPDLSQQQQMQVSVGSNLILIMIK